MRNIRHMKIIAGMFAVLASGFMSAEAATTMSAKECVARHKELSAEHAALSKAPADLKALGEQAELVGDDYADAKERSGLDKSMRERAAELQKQFEDMKAQVAEGNVALAERSTAFNASQTAFQASCSRYFAKK